MKTLLPFHVKMENKGYRFLKGLVRDTQMERQYFVYIITNRTNRVLYTGVTNNLRKRIYQHKNKLAEGFSKRYHVNKLVYYEVFTNASEAIAREKQIKSGSREKRVLLIDQFNQGWLDLYDELV